MRTYLVRTAVTLDNEDEEGGDEIDDDSEGNTQPNHKWIF